MAAHAREAGSTVSRFPSFPLRKSACSEAQRWFRDAANFRSPRASEWASEASRTARAVLDRHGADAYVHALEERLGSEAVADVRLDEETAAALRARDSAAFYGV